MADRPGFSTRSIHAHLEPPTVPSTPVAPPIVQTSSFSFDSVEDLDAVVGGVGRGYAYSRLTNPTCDLLEQTVADLEGGEEAVAFASGMAAIHGVLTTMLSAGDHLVAPRSVYGGSHALFTHLFPRFNIDVDFVPTGDLDATARAITKRTKVVYVETITNPTLEVADLDGVVSVAKERGARVVVDSTLASPALSRPLERGADVVVHSASKYLGGHGDLIAGVVVGERELMRATRKSLLLAGGNCAPFVAWLVQRGIKTLALRMQKHCDNALTVARALDRRPGVRVIYPGLASHPDHARAGAQLDGGFGAMVSIVLEGGHPRAVEVMDRLRVFQRAGSLGDAHSLALIPALASHRSFSPEERADAGIPDGFLRLSIGLEDAEDLIADLEHALGA